MALWQRYQDEIKEKLYKEFGYGNISQVPKIEKVVINVGLGEAAQDPKVLDQAVEQLSQITGQKPIKTRAKRSISSFKLRSGDQIGAKVTLHGKRMYQFLDKLFNVIIPRMRDFRGLPLNSFDQKGNLTVGIREQVLFPEIDYAKVDKIRGLEITIVTTAKKNEEAKRLFEELGARFKSS